MNKTATTLSLISNVATSIYLIVAAFFVATFGTLGAFISLIVLAPPELDFENANFLEYVIYFIKLHNDVFLIFGLPIAIVLFVFAASNIKCNNFEWEVRNRAAYDNNDRREKVVKVVIIDFLVGIMLCALSVAMIIFIPVKDFMFYFVCISSAIVGILAVVGASCKIPIIALPVKPPFSQPPQDNFTYPWDRR